MSDNEVNNYIAALTLKYTTFVNSNGTLEYNLLDLYFTNNMYLYLLDIQGNFFGLVSEVVQQTSIQQDIYSTLQDIYSTLQNIESNTNRIP